MKICIFLKKTKSAAKQQEMDKEKKRICEDLGYTLIEIPYWWDTTCQSLANTIKKHRPDIKINEIFLSDGIPISSNLPEDENTFV